MKQPAVDNTRKPHTSDDSSSASGSSGSESESDDGSDGSEDEEKKKQAIIESKLVDNRVNLELFMSIFFNYLYVWVCSIVILVAIYILL